jgi:hypothetical protein
LATITKHDAAREAASGMAEGSSIGEDPMLPLKRQLEELEKRVQNLEASGQDTSALEERVASRVADRLSPATASPVQTSGSPGQASGLLEAGRRFMPAALGGRRKAGSSPRQGWLIPELYAEVQAIFWMFVDTRYRVGWTCRLIPPVLVSILFISWFLFDGRLFYVGTILDRIIEIALVVIAYKVLSREARRYRDTIGDFPSKHAA